MSPDINVIREYLAFRELLNRFADARSTVRFELDVEAEADVKRLQEVRNALARLSYPASLMVARDSLWHAELFEDGDREDDIDCVTDQVDARLPVAEEF